MLKMTVFRVVATCSLVEVYRRFSKALSASIIMALMTEAANAFETTVKTTRLHGSTIQKIAIFMKT
jgi:hypothetical protein